MTSIFNTYYNRNIDRINASFDAAPTDGGDPVRDGKKQFAEILADVEHPRTHSHPASTKPQGGSPQIFHETARSMLTNIPAEAAVSQPGFDVRPDGAPVTIHREQSPIPQLHSELSSTTNGDNKPVEGENLHAVKLGPSSVKVLPDAQLLPNLEGSTPPPSGPLRSPQMPHVAEYHRDTGAGAMGMAAVGTVSASAPPSAPTVASYRRFEVLLQQSPRTAIARATPGKAASPAEPEGNIKEIVTTAGRFYGIDPNLGLAVAQVESSYDSAAVSRDGHHSKGLFQLLDSTGKSMHRSTGIDEAYDPFDPAQNAYLGMAYLRHLHDIFSSSTKLTAHMHTVPAGSAEHVEKLALAAFNAGEGNVAKAQARALAVGKDPSDYNAIEPYLPASTQRYVQRVTSIRDSLALADEAGENAKA